MSILERGRREVAFEIELEVAPVNPQFKPRVICAFCEEVLMLTDEPAELRSNGRIIAYLCDKHATAVSPPPSKKDLT